MTIYSNIQRCICAMWRRKYDTYEFVIRSCNMSKTLQDLCQEPRASLRYPLLTLRLQLEYLSTYKQNGDLHSVEKITRRY